MNVVIRGNEFDSNQEEHILFDRIIGPVAIEGNTFLDTLPDVTAVDIIHTLDSNASANLVIDNNLFTSDGSESSGDAISIVTPTSSPTEYIIRGNTIAGTDNLASYDVGINILCRNSSQDRLDISDNTVARMESEGVRFEATNSAVIEVDLNGNQVSECGRYNLHLLGGQQSRGLVRAFLNTFEGSDDDGMRLEIDDSTTLRYLFSGNIFSDNADDGAFIFKTFQGSSQLIFEGNTFSGNGGDGIEGELSRQQSVQLGLRNNEFSGSGEDDAEFNVFGPGTVEVCFDVSGNTFNSNLTISQQDSTVVTIERLVEGLDTVNTFLSGGFVGVGTLNSADSGSCDIF